MTIQVQRIQILKKMFKRATTVYVIHIFKSKIMYVGLSMTYKLFFFCFSKKVFIKKLFKELIYFKTDFTNIFKIFQDFQRKKNCL